MSIDPVVPLADELRKTELALKRAQSEKSAELSRRLLAKIALLTEQLYDTPSTSAIGAAELLLFVARIMAPTHPEHARHLREIADRLSDGKREFSDLVWLRTIKDSLASGECGDEGAVAAPLVVSAIMGVSRPVLVFRSVPAALSEDPRSGNSGGYGRH